MNSFPYFAVWQTIPSDNGFGQIEFDRFATEEDLLLKMDEVVNSLDHASGETLEVHMSGIMHTEIGFEPVQVATKLKVNRRKP